MTRFTMAIGTGRFLDAIFENGLGKDILERLNKISEHHETLRNSISFPSRLEAKTVSAIKGLTKIDVSTSRKKPPAITVRLHNRDGKQVALFSSSHVVIGKLPESVRMGIKDMPVSQLIDLQSAAAAGYGFEQCLDGMIAKAVLLLDQTALHLGSNGQKNQKNKVDIIHYYNLHRASAHAER